MASYLDLPVELRDAILDSLPWRDFINYCLAGKPCNDHGRNCFPIWRRLTLLARHSLTDSAYDLRPDTCVEALREAFLRIVTDFRLSVHDMVSLCERPHSFTRTFLPIVILFGLDLPRNQVAIYFSDHSLGIYSVARLTTDPPLHRFHLDRRWTIRGVHLCDGNLVLKVSYWVEGMRTRSWTALRFGTLDGHFYGGALPSDVNLDQVVVNENYVVALVGYSPGTNRETGYQQVVVVPRLEGRYNRVKLVVERAVAIVSLALDSTILGVVTAQRSSVHRFFYKVALFAFDLGHPDHCSGSRIFVNEMGCVEALLNGFLLEMYDYQLTVAHRLSSFRGVTGLNGGHGGLIESLSLCNFVYSRYNYGQIYSVEGSNVVDTPLFVRYVAEGSRTMVAVIPRIFDNLLLPAPQGNSPMHFFVGHNLAIFVSNRVFIHKLPVRSISHRRFGRISR